MYRHLRKALLFVSAIFFFSACNKMPDHARYIPKDAVAVVGINLKSLSKKVAWTMITGSKLFKEMQQRMPEKSAKDAISGIEKAGIDGYNTIYTYVKSDTRFVGGNRITGLIPLADATKWENYIKEVFPKVQIQQHGDRKEASLSKDLFVGWNKNLLIMINVMSSPRTDDDANGNAGSADMSAEMDNAFSTTKENAITENMHFAGLEAEGHDISFWLNYGLLMTQYSGDMSEKMGGLSISGALWKDAAFTSGIDFKKGKITGEMRYYVPEELKEIGTAMSAANADEEMIRRLPNQNLDVLATMHISTKGLKLLLEKTGLLGITNVGLSAQGMNADNILDAFTGDMAIVMNDFSLHAETAIDTFMGQPVVHQTQKPSLSMSYVVKINNKQHFQELVKYAKENGLRQMNGGFVVPIDDRDSVYILMNDQFVVASNKYDNATGLLAGKFKSSNMPAAAASVVMGHPGALYMDIQQLFKRVDAGISHSGHDSAMIVESKKLLNSIGVSGGEFKNSAFEYHLDINFSNTEENSIIALMDYAMKMSDADKYE